MTCPECKTFVPDEYEYCLNCGFKVSDEIETVYSGGGLEKITVSRLIVGFLIISVLVGMALFYLGAFIKWLIFRFFGG